MKTLALMLLTLSLAAPAVAADKAGEAKPKKGKICKTYRDTGSRMSKRVCQTATDWADQAAKDDDKLELMNRDATTRDVGGLGSRGPGR